MSDIYVRIEMSASSKEMRKIRRSMDKVKSDLQDFVLSNEIPSKHLLVLNHGLVTGASREQLLTAFNQQRVTDIALIPKKSYSFLSFDTEEEAEKAKMRENFVGEEKKKLYSVFIDKVPPNQIG